MSSINCKGKLLDLEVPKVMGIINVTPDSFYKNSRKQSKESIAEQVHTMVNDGVDIIDIGAMTSKPGSPVIPIAQEVDRLIFALEEIRNSYPNILISVDTFRTEVISQIVEYPIHIINDITGGKYDPSIFEVCAAHNLAYIMMHMQGMPEDMQHNPSYKEVTLEVLIWLRNQAKRATDKGLKDIIIDPGFGFGKTVKHNYELLRNLNSFKIIESPIIAGLSRKSMICKPLEISPEKALNGTTALHMIALQNGANILRVHDVKEAKETIKLWQLVNADYVLK